jgi:hypothetical protein
MVAFIKKNEWEKWGKFRTKEKSRLRPAVKAGAGPDLKFVTGIRCLV